ncbi:hypothetical protein [Kaarinaea lacus]
MLEKQSSDLVLKRFAMQGNKVNIIAAMHARTPTTEAPQAADAVGPNNGKYHVSVLQINRDEKVVAQYVYNQAPEVEDVYAAVTTSNNHLCILYSQKVTGAEISPVILRANSRGGMRWVKTLFDRSSTGLNLRRHPLAKIANSDAITLVAADSDSCVIAFVVSIELPHEVIYKLHTLKLDTDGKLLWHQVYDATHYGKLFAAYNKSSDLLVVVQSNLAREVAIVAMMLGEPYVPLLEILLMKKSGEVRQTVEKLTPLSGLWLKTVLNTSTESILFAGNKDAAVVLEFNLITGAMKQYNFPVDVVELGLRKNAGGYVFAGEDNFIQITNQYKPELIQSIKEITTFTYIHPSAANYLLLDAAENRSLQDIVPLNDREYLLLYKEGNRLVKIKSVK